MATPRFSDDELRAWRGFLRVHTRVTRELDLELRSAHGLSLSDYDVLVSLDEAPERRLRMRDLADAVLISRSGLTRLCDRLVRAGLVARERMGEDARGQIAVLTEPGREALERARPTHRAGVRARFLAPLEQRDLAALARVWERLAAAPPPG